MSPSDPRDASVVALAVALAAGLLPTPARAAGVAATPPAIVAAAPKSKQSDPAPQQLESPPPLPLILFRLAEVSGDLPPLPVAEFENEVVTELGKLEGVTALLWGDVAQEFAKRYGARLRGCGYDAACEREAASAIGVGEIVSADLAAAQDGAATVALSRSSVTSGSVLKQDSRAVRDGCALLSIVGDAVEALYPGRKLRAGRTKGVDPATARTAKACGGASEEATDAKNIRTTALAAKRWALVIGDETYDDNRFRRLNTPGNDAIAVAMLLHDDFGFEVELPTRPDGESSLLLLDEPRGRIVRAFEHLIDQLARDDTVADVVVYYAGHGWRNRVSDETWWAPVVEPDAAKKARDRGEIPDNKSTSEYISTEDVLGKLRGMTQARHVLLVSDSCFAGAMATKGVEVLRDPKEDRRSELERFGRTPSRRILASGADEPVADGPSGRSSVFATAFISALKQFPENEFRLGELFQPMIQTPVYRDSPVKQLPQYDPLKITMERGELVFVRVPRKELAPGPAPTSAPASRQ